MITKELINAEVEKLRKELLAKLEEPKYKAGDYWYHSTGEICLVFEYSLVNKIIKCKHISSDSENFAFHNESVMNRKLTPSEVQSALEAEAVKIGFKKNITIIQPNGIKLEIYSGNFVISVDALDLYFCGATIFSKGKWATIIKEKTSEEWVDEFLKNENYALDQFAIFLKKNNLKITKK